MEAVIIFNANSYNYIYELMSFHNHMIYSQCKTIIEYIFQLNDTILQKLGYEL